MVKMANQHTLKKDSLFESILVKHLSSSLKQNRKQTSPTDCSCEVRIDFRTKTRLLPFSVCCSS